MTVTARRNKTKGIKALKKIGIKRVGGKQKIRINAFDAFENHMMDSAYLISTQKNVKMLFEIVNSPSAVAEKAVTVPARTPVPGVGDEAIM